MEDFDVRVVGAGIVGKSLALSLAHAGLKVALQADAPPGEPARPDVRAYALNAASVALLERLRVWQALPEHAATPVADMQVRGDAPGAAIEFSAWRQRVGALAWITDAALLERELSAALRFAPNVRLTMRPADDPAAAAALRAPLTAWCEGRDSAGREALGIAFDRVDYQASAIAARLVASRPHAGIARQWFNAPDVLALLPFDSPEPGRSYALVWSLPNDRAQALRALEPAAFEAELMRASRGEAGTLALASERAGWPLQLGRAERVSGPGHVLLGDAAHVVHPLAGQGLNLGLADVAALVGVLRAREPWRALGDERLLRRYARERAAPTWAMAQTTDGLARLFADPRPLARELRNRGLTLVNHLSPLKRWLTARALDS